MINCVPRNGSWWFLLWRMHMGHAHLTWCDKAIRCALVPCILRNSGEIFNIFGVCSIFRRKIECILCSKKRIEVIFGMPHAHKQCAWNMTRQCHQICVGSISLRESSSGENLDIYSAHLSIFRRKIDDILCSTKRIEVIFGMAHAHKSYACNRMRQGNRLWVGSVNFAWFGWKCRYLWCLEPILMENRWIIVFYEADRGNLWHGVSA